MLSLAFNRDSISTISSCYSAMVSYVSSAHLYNRSHSLICENAVGRHDPSIAGAEVILAGFAAAVMAVIFCYIRVTRKQSSVVVAGVPEKA